MRPFLFVALAATLFATSAYADPASDAKDLFERGRTLRAAGNFAEAAQLFEKAVAIYPAGLGSLRNAAECEEALNHFATSHRMWLDLKRAVMMTTDDKYKGWQADAEAAAARLAPKLAHVTVHVDVTDGAVRNPATEASKVEVRINGELMGAALINTQLDRDPGKYVVTVTGKGQEPKSQTVELATGDAKDLHFVVDTPPPEVKIVAPAPGTPATPATPPSSGPATRRTLGWIGVGVGAAALIGAGVSLGVRQSAFSDLKTGCPKYETESCPAGLQSTVSRGTTASTLVNVLGIAGGVLAVGGILLVVLSPTPHSSDQKPTDATPVTSYVPEVGIGIGSISAQWSFR